MNTRLWWLSLVCLLALAERHGEIESQAAQAPASPPTGVITGTVTDEAGLPVVGIRVQAIARRKKWSGPYYEIAIGRPDDTDDRGQFRLHSLPLGQYVVAVWMQPEPAQQSSVLPKTPEYRRTYNPGTTLLAEAQPLVVVSGREQSVSISLTPARFVSVSGVGTTSAGLSAANFDVSLLGGPATVGYTGVWGGFMTAMVATARAGQDGSFLLLQVPPGVYTLAVTNGRNRRGQPLEIAEIPIEVRNAPLTDVKVATARGATVSGRLEWGDPGPAPWPRDVTSLGRLRATAVGRGSDFASLDTEVKPDGTFQFTDLYGLRRIQAMSLPFNWTIKSVEAPSNLLVGQDLDIKPGTTITDIRIVITNRPGMLLASVTDEDNRVFVDGSVLLMSSSRTELDPLGWGFRATQTSSASMHYRMERVPPGSYLAVAIDVEPYRLTGDTDLMERARAAATPIEIREGETRVELRVVRLRPFVQGPANQ